MEKGNLTEMELSLKAIQEELDQHYNLLPYDDESWITKDLSNIRATLLLYTRKIINYRDEK